MEKLLTKKKKMKTKFVLTVVLISLISISNVFSQNLLDFGKFDIKVLKVKKIESFTSENGDIVKASRRNNQLFEIKLEITSYDKGEFGLYPKMFNCMCFYRNEVLTIPAVAIGTKVKDRGTGKISEYWYTDPEVSIIIGVGKNEKFRKYVVVEVPNETENFYLQGPKVIAEIDATNIK